MFILTLALAGCSQSSPTPTPTATKTPVSTPTTIDTPTATKTPIVAITPTPKNVLTGAEAIPEATPEKTQEPLISTATAEVLPLAAGRESAEQIFRSALAAGMAQVVLFDTVEKMSSGEINGLEGFGALIAADWFLEAAEEGVARVVGMDGERAALRDAIATLRSIIGRWFDEDIASTEVIGLLGQVDTYGLLLQARDGMLMSGFTQEDVAELVASIETELESLAESLAESLGGD